MTVSVLFYGFLCIFALTTLTGWNRSHDKKNGANQMFFRCFLMDQNVMVPFCFHGLGRSLHCVSQLTSFLHTDHYLNQKCHIWIHPFISPVTTNFQFRCNCNPRAFHLIPWLPQFHWDHVLNGHTAHNAETWQANNSKQFFETDVWTRKVEDSK